MKILLMMGASMALLCANAQTIEKFVLPLPDSSFVYDDKNKTLTKEIERKVMEDEPFQLSFSLPDTDDWRINSMGASLRGQVSAGQLEGLNLTLAANEEFAVDFVASFGKDSTVAIADTSVVAQEIRYKVKVFTKVSFSPPSYIYKGELNVADQLFEIHFIKNDDPYFEIKVIVLSSSQAKKGDFKLKNLDNQAATFAEKLKAIFSSDPELQQSLESNEAAFNIAATEVYFQAVLRSRTFRRSEPLAGHISVGKEATSYYIPRRYSEALENYLEIQGEKSVPVLDTLTKKHFRLWRLEKLHKIPDSVREYIVPTEEYSRKVTIDSVELEFYEGNIRNILVFGQLLRDSGPSKPVLYHNQSPISFTDFTDFKRLHDRYLVAFHGEQFRIKVEEVLSYDPKLHLFSDDYSPKDTVLMITPVAGKQLPLVKESNSTILQGRIYSDFVGIQDDAANGLIQTEVSKKVILNPAKYWRLPLRLPNYNRHIWYGFFNYIEPQVILSKIEQNNRRLVLDQIPGTDTLGFTTALEPVITSADTIVQTDTTYQLQRNGYANIIDLIRHANFVSTIRLNILNGDIRRLKSSGEVNAGISYYRTAISDSTEITNQTGTLREYNASTFSYFVEGVWKIRPDPRYGFELRANYHWLDFTTDDFTIVPDVAEPEIEESKPRFWSIEFNAELRLDQTRNTKNRLFFRTRYNAIPGHADQHFFQAQLGYAFFMIK